MTFADKLRALRKEKDITQDEVAKAIKISRGSYLYYEKGDRMPRNHETYEKLAKFFKVDVSYLFGNDEIFVETATEKYGGVGRKQAIALVNDLKGMFAGGKLSDEDRDAVMLAIQDAYWEAKKISTKKYAPKNKRKKK